MCARLAGGDAKMVLEYEYDSGNVADQRLELFNEPVGEY